MPKYSKSHIKAGQRHRSSETNNNTIEKLLTEATSLKNYAALNKETYIPDPLLAVVRISAWPSIEWYTVVLPNGTPIQAKGIDKSIAYIVSQICKQCTQTQAESNTWPVVIVSLPEPRAKSQTGEILAVLDDTAITKFAELGFKLPLSSSQNDAGFVFSSEPEVADVNLDTL